jgi:predicted TIM-barrel fold metal-dependent hydrolase
MYIIDAHTHIFPDSSAASILEHTRKKFKVEVYGKGTAEDLISQMDENGVNQSVIHMVALNPRAVTPINRWLISLKEPRFIKFGTLHPLQKNIDDELRRLVVNGIRGVKLQPEVQGFTVDNTTLTYPLYEALAKSGLMVMFHVGGNPTAHPQNRSQPGMILRVAQDFPELTIIAAHLGGLHMWDMVVETLVGRENVFMETSLTYGSISEHTAEKIFKLHGYHKIFFGTDYPFAPITMCRQSAMGVPFLNEREKRAIMGLNALHFFNI